MCLGTTFLDNDYTDDSGFSNNNVNSPFSMALRTPPIFIDPGLMTHILDSLLGMI